MKSLQVRASVYAIYASLIWSATILFSAGSLPESTSVRSMVIIAVASVLGATASIVAARVCAKRGHLGLPEYFAASIGRTCVPCCLFFVCLITMDEAGTRAITYRILAAYFLTAPVHVWLTLPSEGDIHKELVESMKKN